MSPGALASPRLRRLVQQRGAPAAPAARPAGQTQLERGDHYRLIPERRLRLDAPGLDDRVWAALGIPVDVAFVTVRGATGTVVARYPSPIGLTTAAPARDAWEQVVAANPSLAEMEPDVEALLMNRARGARERWLVPIVDCFRL